MITLEDSIEIRATPQKIFEWFRNLDKHYDKWHPDHIKWVNETGGMNKGDIVYFEEYLHGEIHKWRGEITRVEENRLIEYRFFFPMSLICPKGSFVMEPKGQSTVFTATLYFRFGGLLSMFAKNRAEAMRVHAKEEGENLKRVLES